QYSDIIYQEDLERVAKEVTTYSESGSTEFTQEYRILSKSKEILWIDDRTFVRRNSDGEITHFQSVILDITDKKKIQQELENVKEKFQMFSEQILVAMGIIQDGKIVYANKKAAEIFGYTLDEMKNWASGEFIKKMMHPEDIEFQKKYINQLLNDPTLDVIEFQSRGIKKSGEIFWGEAFFKRFFYNNRPAILSMFIDITKRKTAENILRFTQFVLDHSAEPAFWMDSDAKLIYVNEATCHSLGYSQEELLNMRIYDFDPDFSKEVWASYWQNIKEKGSLLTESHHQRKNGEIFPVEIYLNYLNFENKEYNCAFARDISERKESEKKLRKSEAKYRESFYRENFYKDLFTHDMRNILQSICSSLEIYEHVLNAEMGFVQDKTFIEKIHFQINRAAYLIKNIKKFSELESFEQSLVKVNIYQIIQRNISNVQNSIQNKKTFIQLEPEKQTKFLINGNKLINEAIENILLNSIIYNDNEDIYISIFITKVLKNQKSYIRVQFSDNGRGIEDSRKDIIFNRVYSQNKSTLEMGLGLSLVKKIVEKLNGYVWVEDRVQGDYKQGSKFIMLLPEVN
ncbi:MAG: PAS domain S-box protein, partial [Promethearchaeota archaeon]